MKIVPQTKRLGAVRTTLSHKQLIPIAARWLRADKSCDLVLMEMTSASGEVPDSIGWKTEIVDGKPRTNWSVLIECKANRADYLQDGTKLRCINQNDNYMGQERYYLAPPNIIDVSELREGWGLLETDGRHVNIIVKAEQVYRPERSQREVTLLVMAVRRLHADKLNRILSSACK